MPLTPDLEVFGRARTLSDFRREQEDRALQTQLAQAQIKKAMQLDADALGEQAFIKAAQGLPLSPQELAAAQLMDAKSGGVSFNPVTGDMMQKPRISERIGLPGGMQSSGSLMPPPAPTGNPAVTMPYDRIQPIDESQLNDFMPKAAAPMQQGGLGNVDDNPAPPLPEVKIGKNEMATKQLIETEPYFQTAKGRAEGAKLTLEARMKDMQDAEGSNKPMPSSALTLQNKIINEVSGVQNVISNTQKYIDQIDSGKLNLGPFSNLASQARNVSGMSTEQSRNFSSFKSDLEKLRNDSLRLNSGVQTDGDAQRAWNELVSNLNDPAVVRQRLEEINGYNQTAFSIKQAQLEDLRSQYGKPPIDLSAAGKGKKPNDAAAKAESIFNAKKAIRQGANAELVKQRLIENGINPSEAGL